MMCMSLGCTGESRTRTRISPGPGFGFDNSRTPRTSLGPPVRSKTNAFINAVPWSSYHYDDQTDNGRQRARRSQLRFGCLRIIPHVVRHLVGVHSDQPISQYLESRKRPVCDCALHQQAVLVVGQELQALDLVSFDGALPSEKGRASVDLAFEDVLAGIVAAL